MGKAARAEGAPVLMTPVASATVCGGLIKRRHCVGVAGSLSSTA